MLFDLRGRGRRRVVQVIYLSLAILMGGGLVLFGIGGNTSGGLFDAFSSDSDNGTVNTTYTKQIENVQKTIDTNPKNAAAWARMASLRLAEGGSRGGFEGNKDGLEEFEQASTAWERYVALKPLKTNLSVANQMLNLYGETALNQPDKAVAVMDILVDQTTPPEAQLYTRYAILAFTAGQDRKGDQAAEKAVALTPKADRKALKDGLAAQKTSIAQAKAAKAQEAAGAAGAGEQTAPVTPAPATGTTTTPKKK